MLGLTALNANTGSMGAHEKALKAVASQFEAVLLETLVGGLQKTFSALGKGGDLGLSGTYDYLGTQALASAWARAGGIGVGRMITDKFKQHSGL